MVWYALMAQADYSKLASFQRKDNATGSQRGRRPVYPELAEGLDDRDCADTACFLWRPYSVARLPTQISLNHLRITEQVRSGISQHNLPVFQHITVLRNPQGLAHVLLD